MMVPIKVNLAHDKNHGGTKRAKNQFIVIHYTGNDGDHDEGNGNYFKNTVIQTSAHYFVDSDSITQSVLDDVIAYHCGTKKGYKHPTCRNSNSLGIELCDDKKDGRLSPSAATVQNALELTKMLMKKYNIPASNVIRHYDVTGKLCPAYWVDNAKWKTEFWNKLQGSEISTITPAKETFKPYVVSVTVSLLNIRAGAGTEFRIQGAVNKGQAFTIVEEKGDWGKLKSGAGWINLKYTKKV